MTSAEKATATSAEQTEQAELIKGDLQLGEFMLKYPELSDIPVKYGIHLTGCSTPTWETLENLARSYMPGVAFDDMLKELNEAAAKLGKEKPSARPEAIDITPAVVNKATEIIKRENKGGFNLRIRVLPGGCAGYTYEFALDDEQTTDDVVIDKGELKVLVDKTSLQALQGSIIDYVETLQKSGFKVDNPNAKATCSCGSSFG